jgi:hypothetical protein
MITIPRKLLEAFIDPKDEPFRHADSYGGMSCVHCVANLDVKEPHSHDCPVRIAQELLAGMENGRE